MITFRQITNADELLALNDYYTLAVQAAAEAAPGEGITSFSMMHVLDGEIINEAVIPIDPEADEESAYSEGKVADGLSRLLIDSNVISEPEDLRLLRSFLDRMGYEGEIRIVPAAKLAKAVFPDLEAGTPESIAAQLGLEINEPDAAMRSVRVLDALFRICRREMGGAVPEPPAEEKKEAAAEPAPSRKEVQTKSAGKKRISTKKLKQVSEDVWKTSPWIFIGIAAVVLVLVVFLILPKKQETKVDRNEAPVNYLVLSWNDTGKYGTKMKGSDAVQFRIPYGVYNVLNNNSIPVEVEIVKEGADLAKLKASDQELETASELSTGNSGETEVEEPNKSEYMKVTIRPNSSRQVTIDEEQYLMLSEDAENLVFFYLSPVPDEPESDTTGQVSQMQSVVYAYVKGTEVRFRKAPSLEGQVIDSLNDGQQVQVLAITGEWTHVQVGDQKGYIFSQYLTSDDPAAVKKPETEQPAASEAPTASPSPSPNAAQAGTAATPTPSPAAAASSGTTAASSGGNAAARPSTTTASGDRPSNAIENSPLANGAGTTSQQTDSSGGDDDVTVSATGPTADAGAAQASLATVTPPPSSGGGGEAISSRSGDPSEIAVPANEYPTQNEPTPVE